MRPSKFLGGLALAAGAAYAGAAVMRRVRAVDLAGQTVLITGGSRGLGLLLAREFARHGCRIAICARDAEELQRARDDLESLGAEVVAGVCDVGDRAAVEAFADRVTTQWGGVDVLVNNAGIIQAGSLESMTHEDFDRAMAAIFRGALHATLAVLPQMRERRGGRIVNITSIGGTVSVPHVVPYGCAKAASVALSQGLHAELDRDGIVVTTVVPWFMRIGSYLNAEFHGRPEAEYRWFSTGSALPLLAVKGERAARKIVDATRCGDAFAFVGVQASVASRLAGLFPGTTSRVLAAANRMLPNLDGRSPAEPLQGVEAERRIGSPLLGVLTAAGRAAARRTLQTPKPSGEQ